MDFESADLRGNNDDREDECCTLVTIMARMNVLHGLWRTLWLTRYILCRIGFPPPVCTMKT